jgi:uncharacterized protein YegP (UPF0339 family)
VARKPKFVVRKARDGYRWRLVAGNGRIVATGEAHTAEGDALRAIDTVRLLASVATVPRKKPGKVPKVDLSGIIPSTRPN